MEEYWNPNKPAEQPVDDGQLTEDQVFEQFESDYVEPPKPKKKKTFKKRVRRAVRRFLRMPLLTRIIAIAAVVAVLTAIVLLLIFIPRNCSCKPASAAVEVPSASPTAEPVLEPTDTPAPTDEPVVTATPFIIPALTGNLKAGDTNAAVVPYVRQKLIELGYLADYGTLENPGEYDTATVNAVKRFQYRNFSNDVRAWDGIIGQTTYDLLTSSSAKSFFMRKGDDDGKLFDGDLVTAFQKDLIQLGYLKINATGVYDEATYEAVKSFQRANGLSADGIAGLRTLQLVDQLIENPVEPTGTPAGTDVIVPDTTATQNP